MARKKSRDGRQYAAVARAFPGSLRIATYEEYVALHLNTEWERVSRMNEIMQAVLLATDERCSMPNEWIDLLTDDPVQRARMRNQEFRKGV